MKTIAVVDTQWTGHIPTYHKIIVERLSALGYRVISVSPKPVRLNREIGALKKIYFGAFKNTQSGSNVTDFSRAVKWWVDCRDCLQEAQIKTNWKIDLVFFPGIESNVISKTLTGGIVDQVFPFKWFGLYLTPKYLRKSFFKFAHKRIFRKDRFFEAENCTTVAVLDEGVMPRLQSVLKTKKIVTMPDFTDINVSPNPPQFIHQPISAAKENKIIGLLGELSRRKGIETLLDVAHFAKLSGKPWHFLFAGPLNSQNNDPQSLRALLQKIEGAPNNCSFHLSRISSDSDFNFVFSKCDLIYASYEKFYHSSNLLTKAAHFKKPIIVSQGHCMSERVKKFNLGISVPENNVKASLEAISTLLEREIVAPRFEEYYSLHSVKRLDLFLQNTIESFLNLRSEVKNLNPAVDKVDDRAFPGVTVT